MPLPDKPTAATNALATAEAEGLSLLGAANQSGYRGVRFDHRCLARPYVPFIFIGGKEKHLGTFSTAEEAALRRARALASVPAAEPSADAASTSTAGAIAAAPLVSLDLPAAPMPIVSLGATPHGAAQRALEVAKAEGLVLQTSDNGTGFRGVKLVGLKRSVTYEASISRSGKWIALGRFDTAVEAALCRARTPEGRTACMRGSRQLALSLEEAADEGLCLEISQRSSTGYVGVYYEAARGAKPHVAKLSRAGKMVSLGCFASREDAARCVARAKAGGAGTLADRRCAQQQPQQQQQQQQQQQRQQQHRPAVLHNSTLITPAQRTPTAGARVKPEPRLGEQPPPMPADARVKLEFV